MKSRDKIVLKEKQYIKNSSNNNNNKNTHTHKKKRLVAQIEKSRNFVISNVIN